MGRSYAGFVGSDDKMVFELVCFSAKKLYFCCISFCITFLHDFLHNEHTCNLKNLRNRTLYLPKKVFLDFCLYVYSKTFILSVLCFNYNLFLNEILSQQTLYCYLLFNKFI